MKSIKAKTMKKNLMRRALVALAVVCSLQASAQNEVKPWEFEAKVGATYPLQKFAGSKTVGPLLGLEARRNLESLPVDVGAEIYVGSACYDVEKVPFIADDTQSNRTFSLAVVGDYNFLRGSKVSPFVGLGLGLGFNNAVQGDDTDEGSSFVVTPRVGVELFSHLRLSVEGRFSRKHYHTVGLSVGFVIGGGRK